MGVKFGEYTQSGYSSPHLLTVQDFLCRVGKDVMPEIIYVCMLLGGGGGFLLVGRGEDSVNGKGAGRRFLLVGGRGKITVSRGGRRFLVVRKGGGGGGGVEHFC